MSRQILDGVDLTKVADFTFDEPVRLVFASPGRGGPPVSEIRAALVPHGRLRLSGTAGRTFADLDPGSAEPALVALDTIVRSDAAGLERMLLSVLPHVDEIVLGVDGRSDEATLAVARGYADCVFTFGAIDVGIPEEAWLPSEANPRGRIDFAAARNLSRARVHAPWALVIDSDEYLKSTVDLRKLVSSAPSEVGAFGAMVEIEASPGKKAFQQRDFQRLSRTRFRWAQATHNQLVCNGIPEPQPVDVTIVSDTSLRTMDQQGERNAQREDGMTGLIDEIANGNLNALFHLAKHRASSGDLAQAVQLAEDFRSRVYPNSVLMEQRQWVSLAVAFRYYNEDQLAEANRWSCRTLLDGPSLPAFCLLGDIAEDEGDLPRALRWYQAACAITEDAQIGWPWMTNMRWGRLAGIKLALGDESLLLLAPRQDHDQHQATDPDAGQQKV